MSGIARALFWIGDLVVRLLLRYNRTAIDAHYSVARSRSSTSTDEKQDNESEEDHLLDLETEHDRGTGFLQWIGVAFLFWLRNSIKWCLHKISNTSTVERLCMTGILNEVKCNKLGGNTSLISYYYTRRSVWRIWAEIRLSKQLQSVRILLAIANAKAEENGINDKQIIIGICREICKIKKIDMSSRQRISLPYIFLSKTISQIFIMEKGKYNARAHSSVQVIWEQHCHVLLSAWTNVSELIEEDNPENISLTNVESKGGIDWVYIGFQGKDPALDFRSTGLFGLEAFCAMCNDHSANFSRMCRESGSSSKAAVEDPWYSLALASIHVSMYILDLVKNGELDEYILMNMQEDYGNKDVERLLFDLNYRILWSFHNFWMSNIDSGKVKSVMDFERTFKNFKESQLTSITGVARSSFNDNAFECYG